MRYFLVGWLVVVALTMVVELDARLVRIRRIRRLVGADEHDAQITDFRVSPLDDEGVYKYAFKTSNGIDVQAAGNALETIGIYSYTSPEGVPIETRYIADELGFHVVGRHLPKPPPTPDYILHPHGGRQAEAARVLRFQAEPILIDLDASVQEEG